MRPLKIVLGDLSYFNQYTEFGLYTPLNIGYLAAHAKRKFGAEVEIKLFKDPEQLLRQVRSEKPDLVGLSFYYWNTALNHLVTRKIRAAWGDEVAVVWGGPSVDSDVGELLRLCGRFPEVDGFVPNEGEAGFAQVVEHLLSAPAARFDEPLDGVAFKRGGALVQGLPVGLSLDLGELDSPYLLGLLDDFLTGPFLPIIQTSRLCPYTCAFCVSGKNRGKLRAMPMDLVREELRYISRKYADRPEFTLYISDENFGILKRDVEVAEYLRECSQRYGYPRKIFFYNDKRFTETSRQVHEILGHLCLYGLTLSLQSENPDTLQAIKRRNLTPEQVDEAMAWASERGLPVTTELIFGLPMETRESFAGILNRSATKGYDSIQCYNLIVLDGIELNRPEVRESHGLETRFRHVSASYQYLEGEFCAEAEEVAVANNSFSFEDFMVVRGLNLMFHAIFYLKLHHWFFKYICQEGIPLADFLSRFLRPAPDDPMPEGYRAFLADFEAAVSGELFDSHEEVVAELKKLADGAGEATEPIKITPHFGMRLIQRELDWVAPVLRRILEDFVSGPEAARILRQADFLIELGNRERIDLRGERRSEPLVSEFDVLAWRRDKFRRPLDSYAMMPRRLAYAESGRFEEIGADFERQCRAGRDGHFAHQEADDFYFYALGHFTLAPVDLLYELSYAPDAVEAAAEQPMALAPAR
jgi:radical SAM superfamily enzyme YgiQ (UPF0313 family)